MRPERLQPQCLRLMTGSSSCRTWGGAEWPRIEKELRKQDGWADYDMKKLPKLMPIEEALPHIRSRLMWSPAKRQGVFTM
jgi:hypothetical protein